MQKRVAIINPLDLDSPDIQGMGHHMLEEVEKLAVEDTNQGTNPVFPMQPGYDSNLIFGVVGKPMPNNLIQWLKAQKGRIPYGIKIGQDISNRIQANIIASIPSIKLPDNEKEKGLKISDIVDFQVIDSKPSHPVKTTNSLLSSLKGTIKFFNHSISN